MEHGILYIATGPKYIEQAERSAQIAKQHMDIATAIVSDRDVDSPYIDHVIIDDSPHRSFADKPRNITKTPFDKTIYLDTDVYIIEDCSELFEMLNKVDIATCIDPNEFELRIEGKNPDNIPKSFPIYQTGVIVYNSNRDVKQFFEKWYDVHIESKINRDQISFRTTLYKTDIDLNIFSISNNYNFLVGSPMRAIGKIKLIHDTKTDLHSIKEVNRYSRILNSSTNQRLIYSYADEIRSPSLLFRDYIFVVISYVLYLFDIFYMTAEYLIQNGITATIERIRRHLRE